MLDRTMSEPVLFNILGILVDDEVIKLTLLYSEIAIYPIILLIFYLIDITSSVNALSELEDVSMKISMLLDKFISQKDLDDENSKVLFKLLDKYGMVTKQRIEITKQMEFKNLYTSQIENKGSTQVQNIFTNIGNIFNISELDTPTSIIGIAEEVEKYGK